MAMLNSIIIEGRVTSKSNNEAKIVYTSSNGDNYDFCITNFDNFKKKFNVGDDIRVVGNLINNRGNVLIDIEHIEVKNKKNSCSRLVSI